MMSSEEHIAQLANQFAEDGYCLMENFMAPELIENWKSHSLTAFSEVMELIKIGNESFGIGVKNGFKEIVQRHPLRYEMPFGANDEKFDIVLQNTQLLTLVRKILQSDDVIIANRSFVISQPGAEVQGWHSDGPHVSITDYLPCHVLNVFIPLVNIDESNGPTEFRPGSQKYTNNLAKGLLLAKARKTSKPVQSPSINIGSALLFDYRVLHRGGPNKSQEPRPVLVFTFAKNWYRDNLNFPARSIVDIIDRKSALKVEEQKENNDLVETEII